ncbi:hypothetical protein LPJ77_002801 [Coemansia sp. RSA 2523]|nr:hypothetical protein LPJ77_002801 [Coemansia sp. RSA 2523]
MFTISRRISVLAGHLSRRRLWITASSTDPSLSAATTQCINTIRTTLSRTSTSNTCFVLVSQTYSAADIENISDTVTRQLDCRVCGTVVDHIISSSGSNVAGVSMLFHSPEPNESSVPFYVGDEHGRQRLREVAVGRWHNHVTDRFKQHTQWTHGPISATRASSHIQLPQELTSIADPSSVSLILFASDKETRQVLDILDSQFPRAAKLGIVGSQTPFLNGRDYTLLGPNIHTNGVVGVAFSTHTCVPQVAHTGLEAVSNVLRIERCKGNVVLELEQGDAAHLLIAALRKQRGTERVDSRLFARVTSAQGESRVFQVTGGNPAKGGIALDTLRDLSPGQNIQFMMQSVSEHSAISTSHNPRVCFGVSSDHGFTCPEVTTQMFGGATEGGFSYGMPQPHETQTDCGSVFTGSTECAVPGSSVTLDLD